MKELVESLDREKYEDINRMFRGVSAQFKDVFKELVPNRAGELVMHNSLENDTKMTLSRLEKDSKDNKSKD